MNTLIIFLLVSGMFALMLVAGWIMEIIVAKLGKTKKTAYKTKYRQNINHRIQHNV